MMQNCDLAKLFAPATPKSTGNTANDDSQYGNTDVRLADIVEKNGGHFELSNMDLVLETKW